MTKKRNRDLAGGSKETFHIDIQRDKSIKKHPEYSTQELCDRWKKETMK